MILLFHPLVDIKGLTTTEVIQLSGHWSGTFLVSSSIEIFLATNYTERKTHVIKSAHPFLLIIWTEATGF